MNLKDKNIIITGGSKGIGKAIAYELSEMGANLFLVARKISTLEETKREILNKNSDIQCEIILADVGKWHQVQAAVKKIIGISPQIHGLINNAGTSYAGYFEDLPTPVFQDMMQINYMGSLYFTKAVYPYLEKGSFISFTSSIVGFMGVFGFSSYSGPKFALTGLAETLDQEFFMKGIQVSILYPPDTETEGHKERVYNRPYETRKLSKRGAPMKPEEVAKIFIQKLQKGNFLIFCNFKSIVFHKLHSILPNFFRNVMKRIIRKAQKNKFY